MRASLSQAVLIALAIIGVIVLLAALAMGLGCCSTMRGMMGGMMSGGMFLMPLLLVLVLASVVALIVFLARLH
jgi:hypothetical protein